MATEIERKFLVHTDLLRVPDTGVSFRQGYIATRVPGQTVRVRIQGKIGMLTIKGPSNGLSRKEFEYEIPLTDAIELLETLCPRPWIEKTRYAMTVAGKSWEVDVFGGANAGLVVAELELKTEDEVFERPAWLGQEVSWDHRYSNSELALHPFSQWPETMSKRPDA